MEEIPLFKCGDFFVFWSSLNFCLKLNYLKWVNWLRWADGTNTVWRDPNGNHGESFAVLVRRGRQTSSVVSLHHSQALDSESRLGFQNSRSKHLFFSTGAIGRPAKLGFFSCRKNSLRLKSNWRTIATTSDDGDICVDEHKQWHFPTMCTDKGKTMCEKHKHGMCTISVWE